MATIPILFLALLTVGNSELQQVAISSATASSSYTSYPPNRAYDGFNTTFWHSKGSDDAEWLKLELETETTGIREVLFINRY